MTNRPLRLSICVVTYNHEKFIAAALDSFLMQKTDFAFQVIVGDDASTDSTPQILREYAQRYPDIIKPILREENISPINNSLDVYNRAKTEFVAICDGDDYWTDENKLQLQVDFLDANRDYAVCYHPTMIHFMDGAHRDTTYPTPEQRFYKEVLTLEDLATRNPMHTNSLVFRWRFQDEDIYNLMPNTICPGDYYLCLLHAEKGKVGMIDRVMSVYRVHSGGISFDIHKRPDLVWLKYGFMELNFHRAVANHFNHRLDKFFSAALHDKAIAVLYGFLRHGAFDKLKHYKEEYSDYYDLALQQKEEGNRGKLVRVLKIALQIGRRWPNLVITVLALIGLFLFTMTVLNLALLVHVFQVGWI